MIQLDGTLFFLISGFIAILLGSITYFLDRLIRQFDTLNVVVQKIDRDLTLDVGLVKSDHVVLRGKIAEFDTIWDRLRGIEGDVATIKAGGCNLKRDC